MPTPTPTPTPAPIRMGARYKCRPLRPTTPAVLVVWLWLWWSLILLLPARHRNTTTTTNANDLDFRSNGNGNGNVNDNAFARVQGSGPEEEYGFNEPIGDGDDDADEDDLFELSTLDEVWSVLKLLVPKRGSNGFVPPGPTIVADFERIVLDMMMIGHRGLEEYEYEYEYTNTNTNTHTGVVTEICDTHHSNDGGALQYEYPQQQQQQQQRHPPSPPSCCDRIDLRSLTGKYRIGAFVDGDNRREYCILATTSIRYPWGNVVVDANANVNVNVNDRSPPAKNLSFDCPHPLFDVETGEQGIRLLKGTTARSWIVAGSHRMANDRTPTPTPTRTACSPEHHHHHPSDAAHSSTEHNCFLAAVAAVRFYYRSVLAEDYTSVQLHGMGRDTCGSIDTFSSHGCCGRGCGNAIGNASSIGNAKAKSNAETIPDKLELLRMHALAHPADHGRHAIARRKNDGNDDGNDDDEGCHLCGSTNVQGRFLNGVPRSDLCHTRTHAHAPSTSATSTSTTTVVVAVQRVSGNFLHIEQKRKYRTESMAGFWNDVFNRAYPGFVKAGAAAASSASASAASSSVDATGASHHGRDHDAIHRNEL